jgi:hypothetical protein
MSSTLVPDRLGLAVMRVFSRLKHHHVGEATLSQELHTASEQRDLEIGQQSAISSALSADDTAGRAVLCCGLLWAATVRWGLRHRRWRRAAGREADQTPSQANRLPAGQAVIQNHRPRGMIMAVGRNFFSVLLPSRCVHSPYAGLGNTIQSLPQR